MWRNAIKVILAVVLGLSPAWASPIVFSGSSGPLSASVGFYVDAFNNLVIVLTNTSTNDVMAPADVLTAVFFDITGNPVLLPLSAVVAPGSTVWFGGTDPGGVVGGEWAWRGDLAPGETPPGTRYGLSSVGLGPFGPFNRFPGNDLHPPDSPDGLNYGITSAGDNTGTGNTPVTGTNPLIKNEVIFLLGGLLPEFSLRNISNVWFQYGTGWDEPRFPGGNGGPPGEIPEPEPWALVLLGLGLLGAGRLKQSLRWQ